MLNRFLSQPRLERILILASLALGFFHSWLGRYAMDPDGMSYLDLGQSFFRRDWAHAINAYWSPLYPMILGIFLGITKPPPKYEFPVVCLVNFVLFVLALFAFRFLLHALIAFSQLKPADHLPNEQAIGLPEWMFVLLGYVTFLWIALEVDPPWETTPDLAVVICVCVAAAILLRLRPADQTWRVAWFGLILGIGYWAKAILFPLGFVTLAATYWWKRSLPGWGRGMLVATLIFLATSTPLITVLSH